MQIQLLETTLKTEKSNQKICIFNFIGEVDKNMMHDDLVGHINDAIKDQMDGKYSFVEYCTRVINNEVKTNLAILELKPI